MTNNNNYDQHYKDLPVEPVALMKVLLTPEELRGFYKGNILKYALRAGHKPGEDASKDLSKMQAYVHMLETSTPPCK